MTVLCTLWAGNKAGNLRVALFFWTGFLLAYLTAAQFRTRTDRRAAAAALYITLLAVSLYGLWNYVTGVEASDVPIDGEMYRRLGATLEHGINCGEFLAMALPIALVWALTAPTKARRIALTVPLLLPCAAILLTYARTGWIMLARRRSAAARCFFCRRACRRGSYRCSISRTLQRPDGSYSGASVWPCGRITGCSASGWGRRISPRLTPPMLPVFSIFSRRTPICCI